MKVKRRKLRKLYPHQAKALEWARGRRHLAVFMEMRLGKTLVTIRWVREQDIQRVLVIAPKTVLLAWARELTTEGETFFLLDGTRKQREALLSEEPGGRAWWLLSPAGFRLTPKAHLASWCCVVIDESTMIKNPKAKITRVIGLSLRGAPHRVILSGLPAPESSMDYFSQFQFLGGGWWMRCGSFWKWRARYFEPDPWGWEWSPKTGTPQEIQEAVARDAFILSRKDAGMGEKKVRERRFVEMSKDQKRAFVRARDAFISPRGETTDSAAVRFAWMQQISGGILPREGGGFEILSRAKLDELLDLLRGELRGEPVLVWCRFLVELEALQGAIEDVGLRVGMIRGDVRLDQRNGLVDAFQAGRLDVLLLQEAVGQYGLDLSRSSTSIRYSSGFSYEITAQSEDRVVHPGKKEPLLFLDLVTVGSTDELVLQATREKGLTSRQFLRRAFLRFQKGGK